MASVVAVILYEDPAPHTLDLSTGLMEWSLTRQSVTPTGCPVGVKDP